MTNENPMEKRKEAEETRERGEKGREGGRRGREREGEGGEEIGRDTHTQGHRWRQRRREVDRDGETDRQRQRAWVEGGVEWMGRDRDTEKRKIPHR